MEKFIAENPGVVYLVIVLLASGLGFFIRASLKENIKRIEKHQEEIDKVAERTREVEINYKGEFKLVRQNINDNHIEVVKAIDKMAISLESLSGRVEAQAKVCEMVQTQKTIKSS